MSGWLRCLIGRHDWEEIEPNEKERAEYIKLFCLDMGDPYEDEWLYGVDHVNSARSDRVCMCCRKVERRFTEMLRLGRIWREEAIRDAPRRAEEAAEQRAAAERKEAKKAQRQQAARFMAYGTAGPDVRSEE